MTFDICYIRPKQKNDDYVVKGREMKGYRNVIPYRDYNLFLRAMRELWFRLKLPCRQLWYNPEIKDIVAKNIIMNDPLITSDLISYVAKRHPDKNLFLCYENRVDRTFHPDCVKESRVIKCTYDKADSEAYHMHLLFGGYQDIYRLPRVTGDKYDVVFVGRDKGRGDELLKLEKELNRLGLKTCFHICGDRWLINKHKRYYKPILPYTEYLHLISQSRAILNIMPEGQRALTMRDYEVVFNGIKGITNNQWITEFDLFDPSRFFILGKDRLEDLPAFLSSPFKPIREAELRPYTEDYFLEKLLELAPN